jgi:hypothetical protein
MNVADTSAASAIDNRIRMIDPFLFASIKIEMPVQKRAKGNSTSAFRAF